MIRGGNKHGPAGGGQAWTLEAVKKSFFLRLPGRRIGGGTIHPEEEINGEDVRKKTGTDS